MEEKVKQKINGGLRSTYLKLLCFDYHLIKLVVLRLPLHNKNNSSAIAHPTLFHFPHSFTPSLSPYQNAQCNARRSRASSQHAIPYSRPWLGLLLGAAHSLGGHGRANHNLTGPFDLGVKFDGDIAGDIPVLVIAGAGGSLVSLESCQAMASKLLNSHKDKEFVVNFSSMEIYNEAVKDLRNASATSLRILDDPKLVSRKGAHLAPLSAEVTVVGYCSLLLHLNLEGKYMLLDLNLFRMFMYVGARPLYL
ncbi:hypothetical protein D0Y65_001059 [Glycine soja]|uniref:Uncharacterized protein n=1 Tax=Glycine soja TaxID=3848 RepID=A0A445M1F8_GLYSO|nr:hypothetical protein D0Y65_001059 [Glycine soja]